MPLYTQQEADDIFDNPFQVEEGKGWIEIEKWSPGATELDMDGNEVVNFKGWQYSLIDDCGCPIEFLLSATPENADETTRRNDAKAHLITLEKCY